MSGFFERRTREAGDGRGGSSGSKRLPLWRPGRGRQGTARTDPIRVILPVAVVALLGGCVAGGSTRTGEMGGTRPGPAAGSLQHAEASSGDLSIALSLPTPNSGAVVPVEARLGSLGDSARLNDGEVWLRIRTPTGRVDQFPMQHLDSSAGAYQATYSFPIPGSYLVTAEARTEAGAQVRTASVTTQVEVVAAPVETRRNWLLPMAGLGGLGMMVMMAFTIWH